VFKQVLTIPAPGTRVCRTPTVNLLNVLFSTPKSLDPTIKEHTQHTHHPKLFTVLGKLWNINQILEIWMPL